MNLNLKRLLAVLFAFMLIAAACGDDDGGGDAAPVDTGATGTPDDAAPPEDTPTEAPAPDEGEVKTGGELIVGINTDATSYYPPEGNWTLTGPLLPSRSMFDTFTRRTESGEYRMELAESLEPANEDFTRWTMKLRPGIMFHDGTPLDAQAVSDMYRLWHDATYFSPTWIDSAEVIDDLTVEFVLFQADPNFAERLASQQGAAFSPSAVVEGDGALNPAVGTGPFMFDSWTRDSEVKVIANPNYWRADAQPRLDRITFRILTDRDSRQASLRAGDIDIAIEHGAEGVEGLMNEGFDVYASSGNDSRTIIINTRIPPLDDVRVRRSLGYALNPENRRAIEAVLPGSEFEIRKQFYHEGHPWNVGPDAEAEYPNYDPVEAQRLHDEYMNDPNRSDGKAPGEPISFKYVCNADPNLFVAAQLFQGEWGDIGYGVEALQLDQSVLGLGHIGSPTDELGPWTGTTEVACFAESGNGDPLTNYRQFYGDPNTELVNISNYNNDVINEALATMTTSADVEIRKGAIAAIETELNRDIPRLYGASVPTLAVTKSSVAGIDDWAYPDGEPSDRLPEGNLFWASIWLDE